MSGEGVMRLQAEVYGRVQGVYYRATAQRNAIDLGLTGWVRNRGDGSVELVAEGPRVDLERLAAWLWQGPPAARVSDVRLTWSAATGEFSRFGVQHFR